MCFEGGNTGTGETYCECLSIRILLFPEAMDNVDLDEMSCVGIKCVHEEVNIVEVVEFPAFRYQWIPQKVFECDGIFIKRLWEVPDPGELPW